MIEKADHLPHMEQAEPFVAAVNNFIQSKAA
jgi:pimeloyl-ACP methyl ester carboxylesterase